MTGAYTRCTVLLYKSMLIYTEGGSCHVYIKIYLNERLPATRSCKLVLIYIIILKLLYYVVTVMPGCISLRPEILRWVKVVQNVGCKG